LAIVIGRDVPVALRPL